MIRKLIIILGIFLIVYFIFFRSPDSPKSITIPHEFIGLWTTESPRYANRSFKLEERMITWDYGEYGIKAFMIRSLKKRIHGDGEFYELHYGIYGESEQILHFEYKNKNKTIHIRNQNGVEWTKTPEIRNIYHFSIKPMTS
jgi:hypothetical protein